MAIFKNLYFSTTVYNNTILLLFYYYVILVNTPVERHQEHKPSPSVPPYGKYF